MGFLDTENGGEEAVNFTIQLTDTQPPKSRYVKSRGCGSS